MSSTDFTQLPVELMLQIMSNCRDMISVIRLARTSSKLHAVLKNNTKAIIIAVLAISPADFQAALDLAGLEASILKSAEKANSDNSNVNATVYIQLPHIHRAATMVAELRKKMNMYHVDTADLWTSYDYGNMHQYPVTASMFWQCYIKYQRLVIGHAHPQHLPAAYNLLHDSSAYDFEPLDSITKLLRVFFWIEETCDAQFARQTIAWECKWCIDGDSDNQCRSEFEWFHEEYGREKVALMYGPNKTPWTKWPREEFWPGRADDSELDSDSSSE